MLEYGRKLIAYNIDDKQLFKENFFSAAVVNTISTIYDVCLESLNETEKKTIEDLILRIVVHNYNS